MFFIKVGLAIAWLGFLSGVFAIGFGFFIASHDDPALRASLLSLYSSQRSTGELIDQGTFWLLISVALGIAAEMGCLLRDLVEPLAEEPEE